MASSGPLREAAKAENFDRVRVILEGHTVNVNEKEIGDLGYAAIHFAALNGNQEVMKCLVEYEGIDLDAQDGSGRTALIIASQKGHHMTVQLLLEKGADVLVSTTESNFTCLHMAAFYGHENVMNLLLHGKSPRTPWAKRDPSCLRLLPLQARLALLEQKSLPDKFTALHMAALGHQSNGLGVTTSLLEANMAVAVEIHDFPGPLDSDKISRMVGANNFWYQDFLLDIRDIVNGVSGDKKTGNAHEGKKNSEGSLHSFQINHREYQSVKSMKQPPRAGIQDYEGLRNSFDKLNSYVNARDRMERTALHYAAWHDMAEMVKFLVWDFNQGRLSLGTVVNVNATDKNGCTALHLAAWKGHHRVVEALFLDARDGKRFKLPNLKIDGDRFTIVGLPYGENYHVCINIQPNAVVTSYPESGDMHSSYDYGKVLHDELLPRPNLQAFEERRAGLTPLLYAVERRNAKAVEWLLSHPRIDVFAQCSDWDGNGETAWTMALPQGKVLEDWNKPIPRLLRSGGERFLKYKDESGLPPAYRYKQRLVKKAVSLLAAKQVKSDLFIVLEIQICLSLAEIFMTRQDPLGEYRFPLKEKEWTTLVFYRRVPTMVNTNQTTIDKLNNWKTDRSQKPWKITLFHVAVYYGFDDELKDLLSQVPAFVEDYLNDREELTQRTALDLAVTLCNTKAVKMLLQEKDGLAAAEPGKDFRTPLEIAIDVQADDRKWYMVLFGVLFSCLPRQCCDEFFKRFCDYWCLTDLRKQYTYDDLSREKSKAIERLLRVRPDVQHHVEELYRDRQVFVDAANAILVGAALIAGVTFAGWLQPPLNYIQYYEEPAPYPAPPGTFQQFAGVEQYLSIRVFWAFNSLSFFSAIATVVAGAGTVLPSPGRFIYYEVQTVRKWLVATLVLLLLSVVCVLGAFTAAGMAALPPISKYRNNMVITSSIGLGLCFLVLFILFRKLVLTLETLFNKKKVKWR